MRDFKTLIKKHGRKLGKNLVFFLILFVILAGLSAQMEAACLDNDLLVQNRNKSTFRILREPKDTIDVLVLGDSLSYSSVSPMVLWNNYGIASYVCGQSGQKIQETYHMLETALKTQSPKLVILETHVMFQKESRAAAWRTSLDEWANQHIPLLRCHDIWKSLAIGRTYLEEHYKGFLFKCAVQPYEKGNYMQETDESEAITDTVLTYMKKIEALCSEHQIQLLLVSTPSPKNYTYRRHNSLQAYADEHSLNYLDLNLQLEDVGIDWNTDTQDKGDHLNLSGAQKVSKYLSDYLHASYTLPDHRGEAAYAAWETEAAEYSQKAEYHLSTMLP